MARYAIIDTSTGTVINVVEYDSDPGNPPPGFPDGIIAVQSDQASPGWHWDGTQFTAPPPPPPAQWQLFGYANSMYGTKSSYIVTIGDAQVAVPATTDVLTVINGLILRLQQPNPPTSIYLQVGLFNVIEVSTEVFAQLSVEIYDLAQAAAAKLKVAFEGISAGTITTYEEIDSIFA
ncbi:hypothetical protein [Bradyrhizobium sp. HKCCYLS20291]|uniref:hypothetical protein n=1 Tax=Bradyrhizobium sp. HKCCYLS20291 TaxID=3420766 RepID=UPI003EB7C697